MFQEESIISQRISKITSPVFANDIFFILRISKFEADLRQKYNQGFVLFWFMSANNRVCLTFDYVLSNNI